ncbi:MAG: aminotransferase class V-fold PLP-dependent enzyme [Acutalibacteraceae bacterium]
MRLAELGADFIGMPGHKALYGPQGTGLLLCARMPDTASGGRQRQRLARCRICRRSCRITPEAGTQNVCGICGTCRRAALCAAADTRSACLRTEIWP